MEIKNRPNPNEAFPNPKIPSLCFIKNVVKNPRIIIGDYTYYDDVDGADQFEKHVTHSPSTDHSREYIPLVCCGKKLKTGINLGTRDSFADIGATILDYFGQEITIAGTSFLKSIL